MSLYKDPHSENWYASITVPGQPRLRRSTGTASKTEAKRIHDEWLVELKQRRDAGKSWSEAALAWLQAGQRGESDRYMLRALTELIGADAPLAHLSAESLTAALNNKTPGNFNRYRNLVVAILNHARHLGWLETVPTLRARKAPPGRIRWLTREEWARLDAALAGHHLQPLARFAIATGLRQANVLNLRWPDVDLARRVLWVHPDEAKAKKPIGIPLSDDAIAVLRNQIGRHEDWVFPYAHRPARGENEPPRLAPLGEIGQAFERALIRAGIDVYEIDGKDRKGQPARIQKSHFRWHDLRHTWASWHVMAGTPLEVLQKLGGWSSLQMVLRYAHLAPDHLAGFANNAKPYSISHSKEKTA